MIKSSEISVVIQGPVYPGITVKAVQNIMEKLPDAQIIVSTWNGTDVSELPDNIDLVFNQDPGGIPFYDNPIILNASNRQIVSTVAGARKAKRKYTIKMRSDMFFENLNFLKYWDKYPERSDKYRFLEHRIITSTSFAPNPHREPKPYHPSDWFFFGLTNDIIDVFDSVLCPEPETSRYFESHKRPIVKYDSWIPALTQYATEQYIWVAFIRRHMNLDFNHCFDIDRGNIERSEAIFANNVIMLDVKNIGYGSFKHKNIKNGFDLTFMYSHNEWLRLYKKYCNAKIFIPIVDLEKIRRLIFAIKNKKHIKYSIWSLFGRIFPNQLKYE